MHTLYVRQIEIVFSYAPRTVASIVRVLFSHFFFSFHSSSSFVLVVGFGADGELLFLLLLKYRCTIAVFILLYTYYARYTK